MDTCMLKSRSVEGDSKKDYGPKDNNQRSNENSLVNGIITYRTEPNEAEDKPVETPVTEAKLRTRRVMFAQDLDHDSD